MKKCSLVRYLESAKRTGDLTSQWACQKQQILQELLEDKLILNTSVIDAILKIEQIKKALESLAKGDL